MSTPTVLLAVTHGFAARYLLQTDVLAALQRAGATVVVLAPNAEDASMASDYPSVRLEPLRSGLGRAERSSLWFFLSHVRMFALAGRSGAFLNRWEGFEARYRTKNPWMTRAIRAGLRVAWRSRAARRALVRLESRLYAPLVNADAFERWRPDVVATASVGYVAEDALVLREARRRGVPCAGIVMGWDNPTSKGYRGADPDRIVVWSDRMADLVSELQDFPRPRIDVAGVAHFDRYVRPGALPARKALCAQLGLDPARPLILYATSSPGAWTRNVDVAETLVTAIDDGRLAGGQLVVRVHPNYFRADTPASLGPFERLAANRADVRLDRPGIVAGGMRIRLDNDDATRLGALIAHADVLVNMFSTTTVEACLCDTPVVQVSQHAYDAPDERFTSGRRQAWPQYIHMRRVVEIGAARTAESPDQLVSLVAAYLANPALDRAARADAARVECGPTDGHAGERLAGYLLALARES
jgi:hypothetical protein